MKKFLFALILICFCNKSFAVDFTNPKELYNGIDDRVLSDVAFGYIIGGAEQYITEEKYLGAEIKCREHHVKDYITAFKHLYNRSDYYHNLNSSELIKAAVTEFCEIKPNPELNKLRLKIVDEIIFNHLNNL